MAKRHRLLVSGASGFVGRHLIEAASAHPEAKDLDVRMLSDENGVATDVRDAEAVTRAIRQFSPTAIVHLAAVASPREASTEPRAAWEVNLLGTFNLAHATMRHAPEALFVFAGSSEVYGQTFARSGGRPVAEGSVLEPISTYGATKAAADLMLGQMSLRGLRSIRFRPFNHTGSGQAAGFVVPAFARQIVRVERGWQDPLVRVGSLAVKRDFLDVRDVVRAYLSAALDAGEVSGPCNLATGRPVAVADILEGLCSLCPRALEVVTDPARVRLGEIATMSGDPRRAKAMLGWKAEIPLETTLRDVLEYWRRLADSTPHLLLD